MSQQTKVFSQELRVLQSSFVNKACYIFCLICAAEIMRENVADSLGLGAWDEHLSKSLYKKQLSCVEKLNDTHNQKINKVKLGIRVRGPRCWWAGGPLPCTFSENNISLSPKVDEMLACFHFQSQRAAPAVVSSFHYREQKNTLLLCIKSLLSIHLISFKPKPFESSCVGRLSWGNRGRS